MILLAIALSVLPRPNDINLVLVTIDTTHPSAESATNFDETSSSPPSRLSSARFPSSRPTRRSAAIWNFARGIRTPRER
jgi:hypothetical protein